MSFLRLPAPAKVVKPIASNLAAAAIILVLVGRAGSLVTFGQEEDPPRLVLTTGGPVAPDRALAFAPTSDRFYSAGDDKVVRVWDVTTTGAQKGVQAVLADHLRWEIARGFRGSIQALAISPVSNRLAFAGVSARDASGNIVIYDTALGDLERVLRGHRQTIVSLVFAPDGKRLASVSKDGETRVWSVGDWNSTTVRPADNSLSDPRPATFLADGRLAVGVPDTDEPESRWWITVYDVTAPDAAPQRLSTVHPGRVMALARDGQTSRWASADAAGKVYVWSDRPTPASQLSQPGRIVTCLAFGTSGRLFFTTRSDRHDQSVLELWDVDRRQRIDQVPLAAGDGNAVCAASSDGSYAVAYAPLDGEVVLFSLCDSKRVPYDKPLSAGPRVRLRGSGRSVWKVAFDAGKSYRMGLATAAGGADTSTLGDYGTIDQVFDPVKGDLVSAAQLRIMWRPQDQNPDGWTLAPDQTPADPRARAARTQARANHLGPGFPRASEVLLLAHRRPCPNVWRRRRHRPATRSLRVCVAASRRLPAAAIFPRSSRLGHLPERLARRTVSGVRVRRSDREDLELGGGHGGWPGIRT